MANPYFMRNQAFAPVKPNRAGQVASTDQLEQTWAAPSATPYDTGRMSYEGTVIKTSGLLILLFAAAAVTWLIMPELFWVGMIVGLILGIINSVKRHPSAALITAYAVAEGVFLGGFSALIESQPNYQGIALQALLATGITASVCLWLYRSGRVRVTDKFQKVLMIGLISYGIFCLVNLGMVLFGHMDGWGMRSHVTIAGIPLGLIIGIVAVLLASMTLIMDFDGIKRGVEREAPSVYEWAAAFGLIVTLVWLYIEFIRILAIMRNR